MMKRYPLPVLLIGTLGAFLIALFILIIGLQPSLADIQLLTFFMVASGLGTMLTVYLLYEYLLMNWMNSLRWSLVVTVITSVLIVFLNVWATAQLMFINAHDLILTTALLVFGGLTAIIFGWFIAQTLAYKISAISAGVKQLALGNLETHIEVKGQDELSQLAQMFNTMVGQLKEIELQKQSVEQTRRDLVSWISHDLRTPLTAIQVSLEAISDGVVEDEEMIISYVNSSLAEVENLKTLIADLFAIAQLDSGHLELAFVQASLSDLISDTVSSMRVRAHGREIQIQGAIESGIDPVYIAPEKIQRVLYNLIDNAIRYTPNQGSIIIRAKPSGDAIQVDVENSGTIISQEHLPHIFDKFYRGESARKQTDGHRGMGLGLAIARGFVEAHQGTIWVQSENGITCFSFLIPRHHPAF